MPPGPSRTVAQTRSGSKMRAATITQSLASSRRSNIRKATPYIELISKPKKEVRGIVRRRASSSESAARALPPCALPVEILAMIFEHLCTLDVISVAQVCQSWFAAATLPSVWKHIAYEAPLRRTAARATEERLLSDIALSDGQTVSVDLAHLGREQIKLLTQALESSSRSLEHIRWSSGGEDLATLRRVLRLARCCHELESLELRVGTTEEISLSELLDAASDMLRPLRFSLTAPSMLSDVLETQSAIFDEATSLEFRATRKGLNVGTLARLLERNELLERLTIHRLCAQPIPAGTIFSAPSLVYLDLLDATSMEQCDFQIDAPQLRELIIDGRILSKLTPASTSNLDALTLRLEASSKRETALELAAIDRIKDHRGSLKLTVGWNCSGRVLELLANGFLWPGLEEVEFAVVDTSAPRLLAVIAARQQGTRFGSESTYDFNLKDTVGRLSGYSPLPPSREREAQLQREALESITRLWTVKARPDAQPLCSPVLWKITTPAELPDWIVPWLEDRHDVQLLW